MDHIRDRLNSRMVSLKNKAIEKKPEEIKRQGLWDTEGSSQPAGGMANPQQARPREQVHEQRIPFKQTCIVL